MFKKYSKKYFKNSTTLKYFKIFSKNIPKYTQKKLNYSKIFQKHPKNS